MSVADGLMCLKIMVFNPQCETYRLRQPWFFCNKHCEYVENKKNPSFVVSFGAKEREDEHMKQTLSQSGYTQACTKTAITK